MEEKQLDLSQIVKVTQLPKIYNQLEVIGKFIDDNLKDIDKLECTEANKVDVKHRRVEINNTLKLMEDKRKEIKKAIEEPYNQFVDKYEKECKEKLVNASNILSEKINQIEDTQKGQKKATLERFFKQYQEYYHLENIVKFDDLGVNITVSASEKSLKGQIMNTCSRIGTEVNLINQDPNREEILLEYKNNGFNYAQAKLSVDDRKQALKLLKEDNQKNDDIREKEQTVIQNVETLISSPQEVKEVKKFDFTLHFKNVTEEQVKLMKAFFESEDIEYSD